VVNERNQLLVIQEKYHPGTAQAKWKLPGGHADKGTMLITSTLQFSQIRLLRYISSIFLVLNEFCFQEVIYSNLPVF
jgi:hypothetical protein